MPSDGALHLGYCTNVHPGESVAEIEEALTRHVAPIRDRLGPGVGTFGLGLRLGNTAAVALEDDGVRGRFIEHLQALELGVFTVNGFPYGDFAASVVKAEVYQPDWTDPERVAYTARVAEALVALPGPAERTISTVAGGFRPATTTAEVQGVIAGNLGRAAEHLARLADRTGVSVRLCLEPEPWTTLETTADVIGFWHEHLHELGATAGAHLGLCYDCCHQAVMWEDAAESIARLGAAGVVIGKVQVSSALHLEEPFGGLNRVKLLRFAEPRYLHQVTARAEGGMILRALDLPELLDPPLAWRTAEGWRCHFHVPIGWRGEAPLRTTRADWEAAVRAVQASGACAQFEVETYSWHVLPPTERRAEGNSDLHDSVVDELETLQAVLGEGGR